MLVVFALTRRRASHVVVASAGGAAEAEATAAAGTAAAAAAEGHRPTCPTQRQLGPASEAEGRDQPPPSAAAPRSASGALPGCSPSPGPHWLAREERQARAAPPVATHPRILMHPTHQAAHTQPHPQPGLDPMGPPTWRPHRPTSAGHSPVAAPADLRGTVGTVMLVAGAAVVDVMVGEKEVLIMHKLLDVAVGVMAGEEVLVTNLVSRASGRRQRRSSLLATRRGRKRLR